MSNKKQYHRKNINDYGNKHNLPDFYGAGLVSRMQRDISTTYQIN